jgi:PAS domain S-box-containing protein
VSTEVQAATTTHCYDYASQETIDKYEIKVLHIDDDESLLFLSKKMLEEIDPKISITNISSPEKVVDRCMEYDLIITDYAMPHVNGIELAKKIRDRYDVPIIIYTGKGSEEVAEEAFHAGIDDYIRKELEPAHVQVLARRIRGVVERDRALKGLRRSEERYRHLFDNMNEGVALHRMVYDDMGNAVDYVVLNVNSSYEKLTGMTREQAQGALGSEVYGVENLFIDRFREVAETGEPIVFDSYQGSIDKHFWISLFSPEKDHVAVVFKDVTDEKRLMEELVRKEERIRNVLRVSPHAVVVTDISGFVTDCNDAALEMFGFDSVDDVLGVNCFDFVSVRDLERARGNWVDRINSGALRFYEYELVNRVGKKFEAVVSGSVMHDEAGEPTGFVLNVEDISERNELRDYCSNKSTINGLLATP